LLHTEEVNAPTAISILKKLDIGDAVDGKEVDELIELIAGNLAKKESEYLRESEIGDVLMNEK
jgi:hypothetical protein